MNRYSPPTFRPAFGVAAAALSAVTLALAVVLPVGLCASCPEDATLANSAPAAIEVVIIPARIEVFGEPVRTVALEPIQVIGHRSAVRG